MFVRDPRRINMFCNRLAAAWSTVPDFRFGQLMVNIFSEMQAKHHDPFYPEEEEMIKQIELWCQRYAGQFTQN